MTFASDLFQQLLFGFTGACVQTLGGNLSFCNANSFQNYNPYKIVEEYPWSAPYEMMGGGELTFTNFPFQLLSQGSSLQLELAPDMTTEQFATYGPYNVYKDLKLSGRYNSGEDIQSMAAVGWYPFVSSVRDKTDALSNYTGYYIANSLQSGGGMSFPYLQDVEERHKMMEKLDVVSMFVGDGADMVEQNGEFMREYTELYPFGCRSTVTCAGLKRHRIRSYFSSCLTLTSTYQGSVLQIDGSNPGLNALPILDPFSVNFTDAVKMAKQGKHLVLLVDVTDPSVLPTLPPNHRFLTADIPPSYPRSCQSYSERIDYCYRLLSQYANHAKVVITSRIHVGLPAAALGVPVIFVSKGGWLPGGKEKTGRVSGLLEIFHRVDKSRGLPWRFDLSEPIPPNPGNHEADRRRAAFWHRLKRVGYYDDAARLFGRIPYQRLGASMIREDIHNNFHFIMNQKDLSDWQSRRAVEAVLFFHPNAKISVHVEEYVSIDNQGDFLTFAESGYDVNIQIFSSQNHPIDQIKNLLYKFGGVFVSKGTFVIKALPINLEEGFSIDEHGDVALMIGKKGSTVMTTKLSMLHKWRTSFLSSVETQRCMLDPTWNMKTSEVDIAITVDQASLQEYAIKIDTECYDLIEARCIFNDELHWEY
eukprot:scaffold5919_cov25-Cyclotella_meneghiniana.AAC.2